MRINGAPLTLSPSEPKHAGSSLPSISPTPRPRDDTFTTEIKNHSSISNPPDALYKPLREQITKSEQIHSPQSAVTHASGERSIPPAPNDVTKVKVEIPADQTLSVQLKRRDFEMRIYELERTVKGVQHTGHVIFEPITSETGKSHAVDREFSYEKNKDTTNFQALIKALQEKEQKTSNSPLSPERRGESENTLDLEKQRAIESGTEKNTRGIARKKADPDTLFAVSSTQENSEQGSHETTAKSIKETPVIDTAFERLEKLLLAAKPLIQQANLLGFVSPENPNGGGIIDILI